MVLLTTACSTSPASDPNKKGESIECIEKTERFGARERKVRSDEDAAPI